MYHFIRNRSAWIVSFLLVLLISIGDFSIAQESGQAGQKIRLAYSYDLMYYQTEDGRTLGTLVPLIEMLRDRFGLEVELHKLTREEGFRQIENGEMDFYALVSLNDERRKKYPVIETLLRAEGVMVTRIDQPVYSLIHLQGRKVGLLEQSLLSETILNFVDSEDKLVFFPSLTLLI